MWCGIILRKCLKMMPRTNVFVKNVEIVYIVDPFLRKLYPGMDSINKLYL